MRDNLLKSVAKNPMVNANSSDLDLIETAILELELTECSLSKKSSHSDLTQLAFEMLPKISGKIFSVPFEQFNLTISHPLIYDFFNQAIQFIPEAPSDLSVLMPYFDKDVICIDSRSYLGPLTSFTGGICILHEENVENNDYLYQKKLFNSANEEISKEIFDLNLIPKTLSLLYLKISAELGIYRDARPSATP